MSCESHVLSLGLRRQLALSVPAGAQLQEQVAALKEEYSRLGDAMEKTQGSTMEARDKP